jgi:acylphosphatase
MQAPFAMSNGEKLVLVRIVGHVQGVGFRAFVLSEAQRLGIKGWVRNRSNGDVEALFAGATSAVEALIGACRRGPPSARIVNIIVQDPEPEMLADAPIRGFVPRSTA